MVYLVMCQFCHTHGEGKKWYLQAKNYSEDLLSDVNRRKYIEEFFSNTGSLAKDVRRVEHLAKAPAFVRNIVSRVISTKMKKVHFGQVVPIEEVEQIFAFVNSIVRLSCRCRHITLGKEKRYCYGISMAPNGGKLAEIFRGLDGSFFAGPDNAGLDVLDKDEALAAFRQHEQEGLCHTVWTMHTPFIAGICNCDRADCLAMRVTVTHDIPVMFRAEYVAAVNADDCTGCRACMSVCQFGAIAYSASNKKAVIDQRACYGCGICRSMCKRNAIRLYDRGKVRAAANLW
jgi:NAD-dependent dihydropyrimidine dehydrogenase PreA subunit